MKSILPIHLLLLILISPESIGKLVRTDSNTDATQTGTGFVRELDKLPDSEVKISTQLRDIEFVEKMPQNDDVGMDKLMVVDEEGENQEKKEPKKFSKLGTAKGEPKNPEKSENGKKPLPKNAETVPMTTIVNPTTTASTAAPKVLPKEGEKQTEKVEITGPAGASETKPQAKLPPSSASLQGPQGPPPPMPSPPLPAPPSQPLIVPAKTSPPSSSSSSSSNGMALPMPLGIGGKLPNYKLIYFDARGICEPIRLLFHYAKVPFDDVRISRKQWLALKDSTVYGKVPILEVDGKPLTYCHTIARYLARSFGLAGRDSWEQAKVDEVSDFHADVAMDLQPYMFVVAGFHQGDKQSLRSTIFLPNVEKHFPVYVSLLKQSGSGFFSSSGITWVDFVISEYMTTVRHFEPQILDKYPAITKFIRKVQTQPQIFDYITNREHQPV